LTDKKGSVKMKTKINNFWGKVEDKLKRLCERPSPMKRLIGVLVICVLFGAANIWFVVSSICNIGKNDGKKELIKLQHIEPLDLRQNDSIKHFKHNLNLNEYEYE
jgi:hypothetical protein